MRPDFYRLNKPPIADQRAAKLTSMANTIALSFKEAVSGKPLTGSSLRDWKIDYMAQKIAGIAGNMRPEEVGYVRTKLAPVLSFLEHTGYSFLSLGQKAIMQDHVRRETRQIVLNNHANMRESQRRGQQLTIVPSLGRAA